MPYEDYPNQVLEYGLHERNLHMSLNEKRTAGKNIQIRRVPGGFIYEYSFRFLFFNVVTSAVFVPETDEFRTRKF